jgi:hypothetical protein
MPIEIRELHIKVTVNQPKQETAETNPVTGQTKDDSDREAIVQQCIEEMVRIQKQKEER